MLEYSDDESKSSSANSDESEINAGGSRTRQRTLLEEIKDNPDLYATRRSERNRKEPTRLNIQTERTSRLHRLYSESSSNEKDDDSDYIYSKRKKRYSYKPQMEFRKRANVSYKEAESSDNGDSDDSGQPKKKSSKSGANQLNANQIRDNPLMNRPSLLLRKTDGEINDDDGVQSEQPEEIILEQDETNVIEEVLSYRIGLSGNTGHGTTFYNQKKNESRFDEDGNVQEKQFLIKWRGWSHIHSTWESESSLKTYPNLDGLKKFYKFKDIQKIRDHWKKHDATPEDLDAAQFEEERNEFLLHQKMECERIIDSYRSNKSSPDSIDYLIKWRTLDYRYSTWESGDEIVRQLYTSAIFEYEERSRSALIPNRKCEVWTRRPKFVPMREHPEYLSNRRNDAGTELTLRDYQLDGVNWLAKSWTRGNSVILADEMGLGKTIQTIGFLSYLFNQHQMYGPFLLVVPLSTICSWQSELSTWAPYMNVIIYTGDSVSRQVIRECEWYFPKKKMLKFHIVITTYELLLKDKAWLNQISWAFLGIDEAHRLKNDESQLYAALMSFNTNTRLLITGTPVHNSLRELWALLHFIMPDRFNNWEDFDSHYNITDENVAVGEVVHDLYRVLEPFLLRRTKKDVEKSLPSKSEQIIRVPMCKKQAELYKLILTKNYEALSKETRGHTSSFLNVVMELKKCCNHTQLVNPLDEDTEFRMEPESRLRYFIKSSGKMMLLDKLLFEMKDNGHRVLIFSQMVRMLDIISDYLVLRGWGFQRLDGSIKGNLRKQAIDHFNAEGSTDFCFLLSTRAGGLGINLATADTVIIFDSDWNPQNDLQAMARAHRIGQTKQVSVYRFVIKSSVEEKIIECAKRKMVLDHLVIQRMDSALRKKTDANKNQPFNKDELNEILKFGAADLFNQDESMDEEHELNIHDILQRAETRDNDEADHNPANELLSAFKVVNITETPEDEDIVYIGHKGKPKLWSEIVPSEFRDKIQEEEHQKKLNNLELGPRQRKKVKAYQVGRANSSSDESSDDDSRRGGRLTEKEIKSILRVMKKFPRPQERIQAIMIEAEILDRGEKEVYDMIIRIIDGCQAILSECDTDEKRAKASLIIGRINVPAKSFLQSIDDLDVLHQVISKSREERLRFKMPFETKLANWSCLWETVDDARLLVGVYEKGMDNWEAIKMDPDLNLSNKILPSSNTERPQSSHLKTRVEYLLKKLKDSRKDENTEAVSLIKVNRPLKLENKRASKVKVKVPQHVIKSAEFVNESDSSKDSSSAKVKPKNKSKNAKQKVIVERKPVEKKPIQQDAEEYSEADEQMFYEMRGPLFEKCTRKMKPIKSELKFLEDLEKKNKKQIKMDDVLLSECLLSVGNHIRSIIVEFNNEDEKRKWRNYLWSFVNFFFDVFPKENLHRIYKSAFKKAADSKKNKKDSQNESAGQNSSHRQSNDSKQSDKLKCNFEAKSYQEYRIKMKSYTGETSREPKPERSKPYSRPSNDGYHKKGEYSNSKSYDKYDKYKYDKYKSEYDGNHRSSNNYNSHEDSQDSYHKFNRPDPKFSRDPRLSKSVIN